MWVKCGLGVGEVWVWVRCGLGVVGCVLGEVWAGCG